MAFNLSVNNTTDTGRPRIQRYTWQWFFGRQTLTIQSRGFVCQTKKVNSRGHITERLVGQR